MRPYRTIANRLKVVHHVIDHAVAKGSHGFPVLRVKGLFGLFW